MYAVVARLTALLGGDIDREYCLKMWDGYPKTSEPDLLYGYTKYWCDHYNLGEPSFHGQMGTPEENSPLEGE